MVMLWIISTWTLVALMLPVNYGQIHSNKIVLHEILRISRTPASITANFLVSLFIWSCHVALILFSVCSKSQFSFVAGLILRILWLFYAYHFVFRYTGASGRKTRVYYILFYFVRFIFNFYRATACNATHGIAVAILSVCPSDACIVTKLNNALRIFWYYTKRQSL